MLVVPRRHVNVSLLTQSGFRIDADWAHGHTKAYIELQKFVMTYKAIPDFRESTGYGEVKQVLSPRWFVAGRYSYKSDSVRGVANTFESSIGFRLCRMQLIKAGYEEVNHRSTNEPDEHRFAVQFIATLLKSLSRD